MAAGRRVTYAHAPLHAPPCCAIALLNVSEHLEHSRRIVASFVMAANVVQRHLHTLHCSDASAGSRLHAAEGVMSSIKSGMGGHLDDTPEHHALARSVVTYALNNLCKASAALKVLPEPSCVLQDTLPFALKSRPWAVLETILTASPNAVLLSALQGMEWSLIKPASQLLQYCSCLALQEQHLPSALERIRIINTCLQRLLSCLKSTCMPDVPSTARLLSCACSLVAHSSCLDILRCVELCARAFELSCRRTLHSKRAFSIACEETLLPCSAVLRIVQSISGDAAAVVVSSIKAALHAALFAASPVSNFLSALSKFHSLAESQGAASKKRKLAVESSSEQGCGTPEAKAAAAAAAGDAYQSLLFKVLGDGLQHGSSPHTVISSCIGVATAYDLLGQQVSVEYGTSHSAVNPQQLVDVLACRTLCTSLLQVLNPRASPDIFNAAASAAGSLFQSASKHRLYRAFPPHSLDGYTQCMRLLLDSAKCSLSPLSSTHHLLPGVFQFLHGVMEMDVTLLLPELPWLLSICSAALHRESPSPVVSSAASILRSLCSCCSSLYRFQDLMQAACQILIDHPVQRVHSSSDEWSNCIASCIVSTRDAEVISKCIGTLCDRISNADTTADVAAASLCMLLQTIVCGSADVRTSCVIDCCGAGLLSAVSSLFSRGGKNFVKSLSSGRVTEEKQLCVSSAMQLLAQSVIARVALHSLFPASGSSIIQPFVENPYPVDFSELSRFVSSCCSSTKVSGILPHVILASVAIQCAAASVADVLCRLPPGVEPPADSVDLFTKSSGLANSALSIASNIRNCTFTALSASICDASSSGELERSIWQLIQARLRSLCDFCSDSSLLHIWTEILCHVAGGCMSAHVQRLLCDPYFYDISSLRAAAMQALQLFLQQQRGTGKHSHVSCKPNEITLVCSFVSSLPSHYIDDRSVQALVMLCLELAGHHLKQVDAAVPDKKKGKSSRNAAAERPPAAVPAPSAALVFAAASLAHARPSSVCLVAADRAFHDFFSSALAHLCADEATQSSELLSASCCLLQRLSSAALQHCDAPAPNKHLIDFLDFFIHLLISSSSSICSQFALSILQGVDSSATSPALPPSFRTLSPLSEKHLLSAWARNQSVAHLQQFAQCLAIRRRLQVSDGCDALVLQLPLFLAYCVETCSQQQRPSLEQATHIATFLAEYVQILPALEPQPRPAVLLAIFGVATVLEHDHPALGIRIINSMLSCGIHSTATTLLKASMSLLNPSRIPFDEAFASSCSRIFPAIYCGPRWQQRLRILEKSVEAVVCLCGGAAVSCCASSKFDAASVFMQSLSAVLAGSQSLAVPLPALRCALDCSVAVFQQLCAPAHAAVASHSNLALSACSWM